MIFFLALVLAASAYSKTVSNMNTNKISEFSLPNGLKLIVKEDHRAPVVISEVWYKVGSSYESCGLTGISHVLEHMMFRGTKKYGAGKLKEIIVEHGGDINAATSNDYTMYHAMMSADKLPIIFDLEADRMEGLLIDDDVFAKEKQVVLEERNMRTQDDPQGRTEERLYAAAHLSSPYHNPTIGWLSDIQNLTAQDLRDWYKNWYAPNNAVVVVVGDVNPTTVFNLAKEYFGGLKASATPVLKPQSEQEALGKRTVAVKAPAKLPWLVMGYNVPVLHTANAKWEAYALEILAGILDIGNGARLQKELVRKQQMAVDAGAMYSLYSRLDDLFLLQATPAKNHTVDELENAILQQIQQLQTVPVKLDELERVKIQLIASKTFAEDSIEAQAENIGSLEAVGISWQEDQQYVQNIKAITPAQIQAVAKKYLISDRLTTATLQPTQLGN